MSDTVRTYTVYGYCGEGTDLFAGTYGKSECLGSTTTYKAAERLADQQGNKFRVLRIVETVTHTVIEWDTK